MELTLNSSIPMSFEKVEDIVDNRFTKVKIWLCHTGKNLNNSYFDKKVIEDAIPSLSNIPILGYISTDNTNNTDFNGHEERMIIDNNGVKIEYIGRAYGMIPEVNNAQFEMRKGADGIEREYLTCEGLLWNKFKECAEIFDRDGVKSQSMELDSSSIEGKFSKDKVFHFSKFKFEGACILGENVTPAMKGSTIEKFSTTSIQEQLKEMLTEFNTYFSSQSQPSSDEVDDINNTLPTGEDFSQEGGSSVDEKLELFTKYSNLTEEEVAELKADIEKYSLEELEIKLNEVSEAKNVEVDEDQPVTDFALTGKQLEQELRTVLSKEKYTDQWDYESRAFWFLDYDENRVYAEDAQDNYRPVGINYIKDGDFVTIDFASKKKIKFVPIDMEGEDTSTSFVSVERNQFEMDKTKEETTKEVEQKFESIQKDHDEIKVKYEYLEKEHGTLKTDFEAVKSINVEDLTKENEELKAYKFARELDEKIEVVKSFSDLTEEEVKSFVDEIEKYSKEDLELQLFALVGKKNLQFSKEAKGKKQEKIDVVFSLTDFNQPSGNTPDWLSYVEQYKAKQK